MFQLYLKKEQYQKISNKFKDHLNTRDERVRFVRSKDSKIEDKMKAFNSLIIDDFKQQRRNSNLNQEYQTHYQSQSQQNYLKQMMKMTQGIQQWSNMKDNKNYQQQNPFNWTQYKQDKLKRTKNNLQNLKNTLKQKINMKEVKSTYRKQHFSNGIKNKFQSNVFFNDHLKQKNNLSLNCSPNKFNELQISSRVNGKQKSKPKSYLNSMNKFNGYKKNILQILTIINNNLKLGNKRLQKTYFSKTFSGETNFQNTKLKANEPKFDQIFKDTNLNIRLEQQQSFQNESICNFQRNKPDKSLHKMPGYLLKSFKKRFLHHLRNKTKGSQSNQYSFLNYSPKKENKINAQKNLRIL